MTSTHTYALLEVSKETFEEISKKLSSADYRHAFHDLPEGRVIDMQGIGIVSEGTKDKFPTDEVLYEKKNDILQLILHYNSLGCSLLFSNEGYNCNQVEMKHLRAGVRRNVNLPDDHLNYTKVEKYLELMYKDIREKMLNSFEGKDCEQVWKEVTEGSRLTTCEEALRKMKELYGNQQELDKLRKFKTYVHDRLDKMGIPEDPEAEVNAKTGCRIEGRLNFIEKKLKSRTLQDAIDILRDLKANYEININIDIVNENKGQIFLDGGFDEDGYEAKIQKGKKKK